MIRERENTNEWPAYRNRTALDLKDEVSIHRLPPAPSEKLSVSGREPAGRWEPRQGRTHGICSSTLSMCFWSLGNAVGRVS